MAGVLKVSDELDPILVFIKVTIYRYIHPELRIGRLRTPLRTGVYMVPATWQ